MQGNLSLSSGNDNRCQKLFAGSILTWRATARPYENWHLRRIRGVIQQLIIYDDGDENDRWTQ